MLHTSTLIQNSNAITGGRIYNASGGHLNLSNDAVTAYTLLSYYIAKKLHIPVQAVEIVIRKYTSEDLNYLSQTNITNPDNVILKIEIVQRGKTVIYPWYDNHFTDLRHYSIALKDNINHIVRTYQNNNRQTFISTTSADQNFLLKALSIAYMPLIRDDEQLKTLFKSLITDPNTVINEIKGLLQAEQEDPTEEIKNLLKEKLFEGVKAIKKNYELRLQQTKARIEELEQSLNSYFAQQRALQISVFSAQYELDNTEVIEPIEYLINNPNLVVWDVRPNGAILITVKSPILNYDKDFAKRYFNKRLTPNSRKYKVLNAVFIEEKYTLYAKATFLIHLKELYWEASNAVLPNDTHYYNPHIKYARCTGTFKSPINEAMHNKDIIAACNLFNAVAGNINWTDTTIAERMISNIETNCTDSYKNNETGELMDFYGVLKQIEEEEERASNQSNETNETEAENADE